LPGPGWAGGGVLAAGGGLENNLPPGAIRTCVYGGVKILAWTRDISEIAVLIS
jgi:hypothetical protein